jgi:site-specific recombinase XerD
VTVFPALVVTAMRASGPTDLSMKDMHLEEGYVEVSGKRGKERQAPIGTRIGIT